MCKIRIIGKGQNKALIDPITGRKVFIQDRTTKSPQGPHTALLEAVL